jgi:toxin ParE1/3/4
MNFKIHFSPKAEEDLDQIFNYYLDKSKSVSMRYFREIIGSIEKLAEFPEIGRVVPEFLDEGIKKYRELIYEHYRIIYRVDHKQVLIIRILDSSMLLKLEYI